MGDYTYAYLIEAARMQAHILAAINASAEVDKIDNAQLDDIAWAKVTKTGSSLADLITRSAADLSSGDLAAARMSANIVAAISSKDITLTTLIFDSVTGIQRNVNDSYLQVGGGTHFHYGSAFSVRGKDATAYPGSFLIMSGDRSEGANINSNYKFFYQSDGGATLVFDIDKAGKILTSGVYDDTVVGTANVIVSAGGRLQRATSNEKHKKNIKDLTLDTSKIYNLRPREFQWDHEIEELKEIEADEEGEIKEGKVIRPKQIVTKDHVGLIAEEAGEFATHNILTGEPNGIDWNSIVTALLAEVKKLREEVNILKRNRKDE